MAKLRKTPAPFPDRDRILATIRAAREPIGRRDLARHFDLSADQRSVLRQVLKDMERDGDIFPARGRTYAASAVLPPVAVVSVVSFDEDGEPIARPVDWRAAGDPPIVLMRPEKKGQPALGRGDKVLARLTAMGGGAYEGRTIRKLEAAPAAVLGVFDVINGQGRVRPTDRGARYDMIVGTGDTGGAMPGDLVRVEVAKGKRLGLRTARVVEKLESGLKSVSLIAIHDHGIPTKFSDEALHQAEDAVAAPDAGREDLRRTPLVTIDGYDARDFDDAVFAEPDDDPKNPGGWHLIVAIADVAWYVRPNDPLDRGARERGNSVYFPDRVVPMLPFPLSAGWCSLKPHEDRPCMAAHLWIDGTGKLLRKRFTRAVMRSAARLTYSQTQAAADGTPDETTAPLMPSVIEPLYAAWRVLDGARRARGALEIDMPERRIRLDDEGRIERVEVMPRYNSHRLIEEFMILANVAAAEVLTAVKRPCMFRVHDSPSVDGLEDLRKFLETLDLKLSRGQTIRPAHFNKILARVAGTSNERLVNEVILRAQSKAEYSPENIGHFGLGLRNYCHFTSPIRRYADLLVHRALIAGLGLGEGGLEGTGEEFEELGRHLSVTERRADAAERDAVDRFTAAWMVDRVGAIFTGRIVGVTRFGLFVTLADTGADGLLPRRHLPDDNFVLDERTHALRGRRSKLEYRLGDEIEVRLAEADPISGSLLLDLAETGADGPWRKWAGKPSRGKRRN